ncbi:hypothetical protein [Sinorhizobium meliloti]|uniref:hypothetical protein n=1 Tax=Rhizobium meliloti TaxID=382 RepID=UPI00237FF33C|nr:hypothetical protein [Sinorhizobium meliloti]
MSPDLYATAMFHRSTSVREGSGSQGDGKGADGELRRQDDAELLKLHAAIMEELRNKNVLRSANNPTGDLAEYLFCAAFGCSRPQTQKGF